jgi:hypothetical protein
MPIDFSCDAAGTTVDRSTEPRVRQRRALSKPVWPIAIVAGIAAVLAFVVTGCSTPSARSRASAGLSSVATDTGGSVTAPSTHVATDVTSSDASLTSHVTAIPPGSGGESTMANPGASKAVSLYLEGSGTPAEDRLIRLPCAGGISAPLITASAKTTDSIRLCTRSMAESALSLSVRKDRAIKFSSTIPKGHFDATNTWSPGPLGSGTYKVFITEQAFTAPSNAGPPPSEAHSILSPPDILRAEMLVDVSPPSPPVVKLTTSVVRRFPVKAGTQLTFDVHTGSPLRMAILRFSQDVVLPGDGGNAGEFQVDAAEYVRRPAGAWSVTAAGPVGTQLCIGFEMSPGFVHCAYAGRLIA